MKKRRNWHRHDYTEVDDGSKPVQAGTRAFVKELRSRVFPRYGTLFWLQQDLTALANEVGLPEVVFSNLGGTMLSLSTGFSLFSVKEVKLSVLNVLCMHTGSPCNSSPEFKIY